MGREDWRLSSCFFLSLPLSQRLFTIMMTEAPITIVLYVLPGITFLRQALTTFLIKFTRPSRFTKYRRRHYSVTLYMFYSCPAGLHLFNLI
jgi:hypothetical protein